ncbi:protein phosphatase 2C domain-containing protein [Exiguobacterium sp. s192]|uniref:protein phosphatase 2C domain-containing protein n=1 Tax=Exiguobacterium sp. s192 TaxID=2751206 RepID=UPI001BE6696D|nr:protein phosphatase 2C domain-containing protein [Exiguobacterium sp. s192]
MTGVQLSWVGNESAFVDQMDIQTIGPVAVGRFGGCSRAGQTKNEDGCLIWLGDDWEFTLVLDAHDTAESAIAVVRQITRHQEEIEQTLHQPVEQAFSSLEQLVLGLLQDEAFRATCRSVQGETACLFLARKGKYLWWLSVGDVLAYLFHPDLSRHHQFKLNERQFFEWIGRVNTFDLPVPCYTRGVRELRRGINRILVTTDGLVECPGTPFEDSKTMATLFERYPETALATLLETIERHDVRDSTTIVTWTVTVEETVTMPGNAK